MSLDKFDYVLTLAEERNLTRAAKKSFISQPALTNYINKLESQLGVKLFDRTVSPIQITPAGSLYLERMKKIQLSQIKLEEELKHFAVREKTFRLGIGSTRGSHWLPYILPKFYEMHPDLNIQLHERVEGQLEDELREGKVDVAIGVLNTNYPELVYRELAQEEVLLAIPRRFDCVRRLSPQQATPQAPYHIEPELVSGLPFLLPYPGSGFYRCDTQLMTQAQVVAGRTLNYTNMNTAYQLAAKGMGALFITPAFFDRILPQLQKELAFCTLQEPLYVRHSVAAYQKGNHHQELIEELIGVIREQVLPELQQMANA